MPGHDGSNPTNDDLPSELLADSSGIPILDSAQDTSLVETELDSAISLFKQANIGSGYFAEFPLEDGEAAHRPEWIESILYPHLESLYGVTPAEVTVQYALCRQQFNSDGDASELSIDSARVLVSFHNGNSFVLPRLDGNRAVQTDCGQRFAGAVIDIARKTEEQRGSFAARPFLILPQDIYQSEIDAFIAGDYQNCPNVYQEFQRVALAFQFEHTEAGTLNFPPETLRHIGIEPVEKYREGCITHYFSGAEIFDHPTRESVFRPCLFKIEWYKDNGLVVEFFNFENRLPTTGNSRSNENSNMQLMRATEQRVGVRTPVTMDSTTLVERVKEQFESISQGCAVEVHGFYFDERSQLNGLVTLKDEDGKYRLLGEAGTALVSPLPVACWVRMVDEQIVLDDPVCLEGSFRLVINQFLNLYPDSFLTQRAQQYVRSVLGDESANLCSCKLSHGDILPGEIYVFDMLIHIVDKKDNKKVIFFPLSWNRHTGIFEFGEPHFVAQDDRSSCE